MANNVQGTKQPDANATLTGIIYSRRNAADILQSKGISFVSIDAVVVPDLEQLRVCIDYSIIGRQEQLIVPCTEFLALAWGDRMQRSHDYRAVVVTLNSALVNRINSVYGSQPTYHVWIEPNGQVQCSCPDYANQFALFQGHPALWNLIRQQPRCKHLLAAAPTLERTDLFMMPTVPTEGSETVDSQQEKSAIPCSL